MLEWNRRSPVSARTVVLSTVNAFETLDEAVILEPRLPAGSPLHESASADIERAFDDAKGPVFLARELLRSFLAYGGGIMSFVSGGPATGAVESAARLHVRPRARQEDLKPLLLNLGQHFLEGLGREELQVAVGGVGFHAMPPRVVDAQQAIARQLYIEVWTGQDEPGNVVLLVPLADAAHEFAGLVVAQHDAVAGIRRKQVSCAVKGQTDGG